MRQLSGDSLRLLLFGFMFSFFSSFGQTYFVAVFGGELRQAFGLSHGMFGGIYSGATLISGFLMVRVGGLMDILPLRRYALAATVGLAIANLALALSAGVVGLALAFFLLRLFGQGMMTHTAVTAMARSFEKARGRAVAFATLGHPAGQAVFPALGVIMMDQFGWRSAWILGAAVCAFFVVPVATVLLRNGVGNPAAAPAQRNTFMIWRFLARREIALAMPALMTPAFVGTAVFFHQVLIAEVKGWTTTDFAGAFVVFSASTIAAMALYGVLVDRYSARRMARYFLVPSTIGCFVLAATQSVWALYAYMVLSALTFGAMATVTSSLFAEVYGSAQLGSIRATTMAAGVVSSALSPVLFGVGYDAGIALNVLLGAMGFMSLLASGLLLLSGLTSATQAPA